MLLQQPIHNDFGQEQPPQQQGPGRPAPQSQGAGVIRQHTGHPKTPSCGAHSSSPHSLMRENTSPSTQRVGRSGQLQSVSVPVQTNTSLTMPFYSNPMMFSQTNTRPLQDANQRPTDSEFSQDGQLRMLLNQPMQTLVPTSSVSSQPSQCNMGLPQTLYTLEQQIIAPSFSMQQVNCNAVLVPSPVFTSSVMIPHNSFITHQAHSAYHAQTQQPRHSLQLQQPHQFFQMTQGLGSTPAFLHTTNVPQQSSVGYIQQQQPTQQQQQQRQYPHSQNQSSTDFRNMLTR